MANGTILNLLPSTNGYGAVMKAVKDMLVTAGWSVKMSGNGVAEYSSTGLFATDTNANFANAKCWFRIQSPDTQREFIFQHDNAGGARIKYSPSAKFTGGSPSATVTPSATDEKYVRGAASDATPSYGATFFASGTTSGTVRYQGFAQGTSPYGFWFAGANSPGGAISTGFCFDPVTGVPEDTDPFVVYCGTTSAFLASDLTYGAYSNTGTLTKAATQANGGTSTGAYGFYDTGFTTYVLWAACAYTMGATLTGGTNTFIASSLLTTNPFNAKQEALPILYARSTDVAASSRGIKGWSTMMRWTTIARSTFSDTLDTKAWICVSGVWLPWDGTTVPLN